MDDPFDLVSAMFVLALSAVVLVGVRIPTKSPGYNGMMPPGIPE